jgi:hypothetical protein
MMNSIISGHVLDNNGRPVANVRISLEGKVVAESQDDGFFRLTLARAGPRVALTFAAKGYVSNTRAIEGSGTANRRIVVIWPVRQSVAFASSHDLDIEFEASRLRLAANALRSHDGKPFRGRARLEFTLFDVTSPLQRAAAPGDFSSLLPNGTVRRLNSWGIFDLAVREPGGQPLELAEGASADLSISVPRRLIDRPPSVGFFNFDMLTARWIEVGSFDYDPATLTYNGTITRFADATGNTQHNLDKDEETTCVTVQVVNEWNSTPMANMTVEAHGAQYTSTGTTDVNGYVCLLVQRNASFKVKAYGHSGNSDYQTITPVSFTSPDFSSDANDCGNPEKCPFLGTVGVDLIVHILQNLEPLRISA